jgi:hypothetical protein
MKAKGQIDLDFADSLIADNRTIANNLIVEEELKLKLLNAKGGSDVTIQIEGGLPPLPGTNIVMPKLNGMNGHPAIEGIAAPASPPTQDPDTPSQEPES